MVIIVSDNDLIVKTLSLIANSTQKSLHDGHGNAVCSQCVTISGRLPVGSLLVMLVSEYQRGCSASITLDN